MCNFPAEALKKYRRELAERADKEGGETVVCCAEQVKLIDQLRLEHESLDGCQCWYEKEGN